MALSILDDRAKEPTDDDLAEVLGRTKKLWDTLVEHLADTYDPMTLEWNFAGEKYGWSARLKRKKRTILYLTPCHKHFLCGFVLGGKATDAVRASDIPDDTLAIINDAPVYAEGRGFRLEVRKKADLETMKKLAAIKMAN